MIATTATGSLSGPANNILSDSPNIKLYTAQVPGAAMNVQSVTPVGGSQPHENMQPFLAINFIISLFGVFPTQT
jgi:microcystin-dependent protein